MQVMIKSEADEALLFQPKWRRGRVYEPMMEGGRNVRLSRYCTAFLAQTKGRAVGAADCLRGKGGMNRITSGNHEAARFAAQISSVRSRSIQLREFVTAH
jgi:hypothetical protein